MRVHSLRKDQSKYFSGKAESEMARVVVVDDEIATGKYLGRRLIESGHEVRVTNLGDAAVDLGHLFRPDVLVVDWNLGSDYDGLEVAEAVHHVHPQVRTILFTAYPPAGLLEHIDQAPLFALVTKPFTLSDICELVAKAVDDLDSMGLGAG